MDSYIYVGQLPFDASEAMLKDVFSIVGTVEEVKIARDPDKGLFRGFAFVKMVSPAEVEKAIAELNGTPIGSRNCFLDLASNQADLWQEVFGQ